MKSSNLRKESPVAPIARSSLRCVGETKLKWLPVFRGAVIGLFMHVTYMDTRSLAEVLGEGVWRESNSWLHCFHSSAVVYQLPFWRVPNFLPLKRNASFLDLDFAEMLQPFFFGQKKNNGKPVQTQGAHE